MSSYAFRSRFAGFDREVRELVRYSNYLVGAYEDTFHPSSYAVPGNRYNGIQRQPYLHDSFRHGSCVNAKGMTTQGSAKIKNFRDVCNDDEECESKGMAYAWAHRQKIQEQMEERIRLAEKSAKGPGAKATKELEMGSMKLWEQWDDSAWDEKLENFKEEGRSGHFSWF